MPLNVFYTMVQKSQKWPKTQIKGGGGPALSCRLWDALRICKVLHKCAHASAQRIVAC